MSFGKLIVATPLSFRGFEAHLPDALKSEIVHSPEEFKIRMLKEVNTEMPQKDPRTISLYESLFTIEKQTDTYRKIILGTKLWSIFKFGKKAAYRADWNAGLYANFQKPTITAV